MLVIGSPEGPRVPIAWVACAQTRPFRSMRAKSMRDVARNAVTPLADRRSSITYLLFNLFICSIAKRD